MNNLLAAKKQGGLERMPLVVKPLSPALGAEILGVDLREEIPPQTVAAILDAWHQHLIILFRNQSLSEDGQMRFARHFGLLQQRTRPPEHRNEMSFAPTRIRGARRSMSTG